MHKRNARDFEEYLAGLDTALFDRIPTQTSQEDRRSLLSLERLIRNDKDSYVYLEIGSHLGGSIQPHLLDPKCKQIYSIDTRPLIQPDEVLGDYAYPGNSTKRMLDTLKLIGGDVNKIKCFDTDASRIDAKDFPLKPNIFFIDGEHTNKQVISDFTFCHSLAKESGVIIFHDRDVIRSGIEKIISNLVAKNVVFKTLELDSVIFVLFLGESIKYHDFYTLKNPEVGNHLGGQVPGGDADSYDPKVWSWLVRRLGTRSVVSVGCGQGYDINYFKNVLRSDVLGIDGDEGAIKGNLLPHDVILHDYAAGPYQVKKGCDLVLSYEFVEHVEEKYKENFLETFRGAKSCIVMTHAVPGQAGWHHVNCQPDDYWIREIEKLGFKYEPFLTRFLRSISKGHLSRNGLAFSNKKNSPMPMLAVRDKIFMHASILVAPVARFGRRLDQKIGMVGARLRTSHPTLYKLLKR